MDEHPADGRPTLGEVWRAVTDHETRLRRVEDVVAQMRGARTLLWAILGTSALGAIAMLAALLR